MLRAHCATGGLAAGSLRRRHRGRVVEQLAESDTAATVLEPGATPKPGVVGVLKGPLHDGLVVEAPTWW
jgi:transcription-repair coupling factor (superfamily II helicase)